MDPIELFGWMGALATLTTYSMKTMVPLRLVAMASSTFFIAYGALAQVYPTLVLHLVLLPFNAYRLWQIRHLVRASREARRADRPDALVLYSYGRILSYDAGAEVFRQGDVPDRLYYILDGEVEIEEVGVRLGAGEIFGEIAFFTDAQARTATARCTRPTRLSALDEREFMRLYFQHPSFGMGIMKLITRRLLEGQRAAANAAPSCPTPE